MECHDVFAFALDILCCIPNINAVGGDIVDTAFSKIISCAASLNLLKKIACYVCDIFVINYIRVAKHGST